MGEESLLLSSARDVVSGDQAVWTSLLETLFKRGHALDSWEDGKDNGQFG